MSRPAVASSPPAAPAVRVSVLRAGVGARLAVAGAASLAAWALTGWAMGWWP